MIYLLEKINQCAQPTGGPMTGHFMAYHAVNFRFFFLFMLGAFLLAVFIKFLVAWIVYKDAKAKNVDNPKVWFFLTFVTSILGALFYFIMVIYQHKNNTAVSQNQPSVPAPSIVQTSNVNRICKNCGAEGDGKFCSRCGTQF